MPFNELPLSVSPRPLDHPARAAPKVFEISLNDADFIAAAGKEIQQSGYGILLADVSDANAVIEVKLGHRGNESDWIPLTPGNSTPIFSETFDSFRVRLHQSLGTSNTSNAWLVVYQSPNAVPVSTGRSPRVAADGALDVSIALSTAVNNVYVNVPNSASTLVLAANSSRRGGWLYNPSTLSSVTVNEGGAADFLDFIIPPQSFYPIKTKAAIYCHQTSGGTIAIRAQEET